MKSKKDLVLSPKEFTILVHIARGLENVRIARAEFISVETVRTHVKHILAKLRARNRAHAVAIAYHIGLFAPGNTPPPDSDAPPGFPRGISPSQSQPHSRPKRKEQ